MHHDASKMEGDDGTGGQAAVDSANYVAFFRFKLFKIKAALCNNEFHGHVRLRSF